jgi:hypothetical protein
MANQSHYEINVSYKGRHLFATAERSAVTETSAIMLLNVLRERFPAKDGYEVTATYWENVGHKFEHEI